MLAIHKIGEIFNRKSRLFNMDILDERSQIVAHLSECSLKRIHSGKKRDLIPPLAATNSEVQPRKTRVHDLINPEAMTNNSDLMIKVQNYLINNRLRKLLMVA